MATAKFDIRTEATKTLYAGAGVVDLGVEVVRDAVADAQKRFAEVSKNLADVRKDVADFDLKTASKEARARRTAVEKRVVELQDEARALPKKVQGLIDDNVTTATDTYEDLAKRGQTLVGRIRRQESTKATAASAKQTVRGAKTTSTQGTKAARSTTASAKRTVQTAAKSTAKTAAKKSAPARSSAKGAATSARKTATNATKATTAAAAKVGD